MLDWLPDYTIKRSRRSKYISIRITPQKGLVLTIPEHVSDAAGFTFLQKKAAWIKKYLHVLEKPSVALPTFIDLLAIHQRIDIRYHAVDTPRMLTIETPQAISLLGKIEDDKSCLKHIKSWLIKQAKQHLPLELQAQSQRTGLSYNAVKIKQQQTRWGSCSAKKHINLNYKLLLLPRYLMEYILIHELCHTVHLNHSASFWRLVKKYCPDIKKCHAELRGSAEWLPSWLDIPSQRKG